jgi:hypothetical protein
MHALHQQIALHLLVERDTFILARRACGDEAQQRDARSGRNRLPQLAVLRGPVRPAEQSKSGKPATALMARSASSPQHSDGHDGVHRSRREIRNRLGGTLRFFEESPRVLRGKKEKKLFHGAVFGQWHASLSEERPAASRTAAVIGAHPHVLSTESSFRQLGRCHAHACHQGS